MKIFGICLIKNEADIIEYSLKKHSEWADYIFVYDNGSTDNTWDIVQEVAKYNTKVIPFKSEVKPFRDGLRAEVFNEYKHMAMDGDWWCVRCDSDELYLDDPRQFLPKISKLYQVVLSLHYEFMLCEEDLEKLDFEGLPVSQQIENLTFYHPKVTSETRFIRHRDKLVWPESESYPRHKGVPAPPKIRLKHYQYRSPSQIQKRMEVRRTARENGYKYFGKDMGSDWKELIPKREDCMPNDGNWSYKILKDPNIEPLWRRHLKILLHLTGIFP